MVRNLWFVDLYSISNGSVGPPIGPWRIIFNDDGKCSHVMTYLCFIGEKCLEK